MFGGRLEDVLSNLGCAALWVSFFRNVKTIRLFCLFSQVNNVVVLPHPRSYQSLFESSRRDRKLPLTLWEIRTLCGEISQTCFEFRRGSLLSDSWFLWEGIHIGFGGKTHFWVVLETGVRTSGFPRIIKFPLGHEVDHLLLRSFELVGLQGDALSSNAMFRLVKGREGPGIILRSWTLIRREPRKWSFLKLSGASRPEQNLIKCFDLFHGLRSESNFVSIFLFDCGCRTICLEPMIVQKLSLIHLIL